MMLSFALAIVANPFSAQIRPPAFQGFGSAGELLDMAMKEEKAPGIGIVVMRQGRVVDQAFRGLRKFDAPDKVQRKDLWLMGSITKSMTSTMIARLIEAKKLEWSTRLKDGLPGVNMHEGYKDISIEALLRHESGVQADTLIGDGTSLTVQDILAMVKPNSTPHDVRMRYAEHLLNRPPAAPPNRKHVYSNGGYSLAATMAENATGMAFDQLLKQYVFDAANLSSAKASIAGAPGMPGTNGQTWGHQRQNGKFNLLVTSWQPGQRIFAPAGAGIAMNLDDLAKFGNYHLRGLRGEIKELSQATFERLHYLPLIPIHTYACGWVIQNRTGEISHWHNGSDGSYYALLAIFPESDVVIAAAANCGLIPNTPSVVDQVVWSMAHAIRQRKKDAVKS